MDHLLPVRTVDNLMSAGQTARYLPLKGKTMTDTTLAPFAATLGVWTNPHNAPLFGVEYTMYPAERTSRYDWFQTEDQRTEAIATMRHRYETGDGFLNTYNALTGDWVFTPDAPVETAEEDTSREAQGRAIATMRARVAEVERQNAQHEYTITSRGNRIAALETELRNLWAALLQQAEDRDWCSEFEDFHESNGGEEWLALETEVEVTMTISVRGRGRDNHEAAVDAIYDMDRSALRSVISVD